MRRRRRRRRKGGGRKGEREGGGGEKKGKTKKKIGGEGGGRGKDERHSRGTEVERQGWSIPWGVAAYDRGNGMGVFLGCSLPRPWHRPIGGCCYLQLRDLPFTLLSAAETLVGLRQQPPHTRQQRQTRRLQRPTDRTRSPSIIVARDQPRFQRFHRAIISAREAERKPRVIPRRSCDRSSL